MRNLLLTRSILCLCILFILTITSCRKEILVPENIIQPVTLKEAKQWVDEHPLAQIVALDWEKARQAGKKHEVMHVPVTPEDRLSQIRNSDTKAAINSLITGSTEPRGNTSEPTPENPNYNRDHPPAILFQKDSAGNVRAFMYNFIPADKDKENGKDGLWTGKLYQWNMKGDTVLVRKLNKGQPEEIYFEASKRTTTNSTAFSKLSANRPDNDMGSIWSWLKGILSGIWEAIAVLAYQLGITSTVPPNSWTWNNNRWSDNEGGNEQTISYLGNDPVGYTFYLNYGGGSYQAPTLSSVDLLMMRLGNQDDAVAQLVESYEYQGMAAKLLSYLNSNFNSAASIDFVNWTIEYMLANVDVDFDTFKNQFMGEPQGQDGEYDASYWEDPNLTFSSQSLPSYSSFYDAFPKGKTGPEVYEYVGGPLYDWHLADVSNRSNACALRVSRALNYSGVTIPSVNGTFKGADGKNYFLSAMALLKWMKLTFGQPTISINQQQAGTNGRNIPNLLKNYQGIYIMEAANKGISGFNASGHADIFTGTRCDGSCYFNPKGGIISINIWDLQ